MTSCAYLPILWAASTAAGPAAQRGAAMPPQGPRYAQGVSIAQIRLDAGDGCRGPRERRGRTEGGGRKARSRPGSQNNAQYNVNAQYVNAQDRRSSPAKPPDPTTIHRRACANGGRSRNRRDSGQLSAVVPVGAEGALRGSASRSQPEPDIGRRAPGADAHTPFTVRGQRRARCTAQPAPRVGRRRGTRTCCWRGRAPTPWPGSPGRGHRRSRRWHQGRTTTEGCRARAAAACLGP